MPTYDYLCDSCDHQFELFQSITAGVKRKCPECGRLKLRRLIGPGAAIVFKGSGFYQTDYRSDSYKKGAEADKKSREDKPGDSKKKSDAKGSSPTSSTKSHSSKTKSTKTKPPNEPKKSSHSSPAWMHSIPIRASTIATQWSRVTGIFSHALGKSARPRSRNTPLTYSSKLRGRR